MAAYHLSVARPLARMFSKWAHSNLRKAASSLISQEGVPKALLKLSGKEDIRLKRSDEIRIFRALYRYETFYHLFGRNRGRRHCAFRHHEINELFFCLFDPWEAEAIGCIDSFVRQRYEDILTRSKRTCILETLDFGKRMEFTTTMDRSILLWNMMVSMIFHRTSRTDNPRCATLAGNNFHLLT